MNGLMELVRFESEIYSLTPGSYGDDFKESVYDQILIISSLALIVKFLSRECHIEYLMIS